MLNSDDTRLDQNVKRIDVGALVTVLNTSRQVREHYYISPDGTIDPALAKKTKITVVRPTDGIAKALMQKMKGEKVFYRHSLVIEFIAWPHSGNKSPK